MLKKEITAVLRYTMYWLAILASIMLVLMAIAWLGEGWGAFSDKLLLAPQLLLLIYPLLLGLSFFSEEKEQKGMEYLLALPYSRLQIVRIKLLVRLTALILVFIPFYILFNANPFNSILFPVLSFSIIYFIFFWIALSFSTLQENSLSGSLLAVFFFAVYLVAVFLVYRLAFSLAGSVESNISTVRQLLNLEKVGDSTWSFWLVLLILLLPFLVAFFRTARSLDLRQARRKKTFTWTFGLLMPLAFLVAAGLLYATIDWSAYGYYYLSISPYRKSNMPVQRLWEDGRAEKLAGTEHLLSLYLGGKLLTSGKEGVKVFSLTTTDQPKLEKSLPDLIIPGWYRWRNSDSFDFSAALAAREVLLSRGGKQYNVLNLQTYGQKIISTNPGATFHALGWPFFRETTGNGFSIVRCQDGQLETLGSIHFQFKEDRDGVWFENGIVTRQHKKVRAYAFPDLHELFFPDL